MAVYPNGAGESLGDTLATCRPLHASSVIWYVNSSTGTDAGTPAGQNATRPLATLDQAITNAADHDIIILQSGHSETRTSALTLSKKLTIVGSGSSGGQPTVKLYNNHGSNGLLTVSGADVQLRNIWFEENMQANSTARITVTGARFKMVGCYVQCNGNDTGAAVTLGSGADSAEFVNCTFISTATSTSSQPAAAIASSAALTCLRMSGCIFSGGTVGFSNYYALDLDAAAITRFEGESISLLLGADVSLHASTVGWLNVQTFTGGSRVAWAV